MAGKLRNEASGLKRQLFNFERNRESRDRSLARIIGDIQAQVQSKKSPGGNFGK